MAPRVGVTLATSSVRRRGGPKPRGRRHGKNQLWRTVARSSPARTYVSLRRSLPKSIGGAVAASTFVIPSPPHYRVTSSSLVRFPVETTPLLAGDASNVFRPTAIRPLQRSENECVVHDDGSTIVRHR